MNCVSKTVAAALWLAMASLPAINGQQPEPPKRRSPSLEADGPVMSRGGALRDGVPVREPSGVTNLGATSAGWSRYSLEHAGATIELPGEPHMITVSQSAEASEGLYKTYFYRGGDVTVFIGYALTPDSNGALNFIGGWLDGLMKNLGVTDVRVEGSRNVGAKRVPMTVFGKVNGTPVEFKQTLFFIDEEKEVLTVLAGFPQANAKARAVATRAVDSVEVPR